MLGALETQLLAVDAGLMAAVHTGLVAIDTMDVVVAALVGLEIGLHVRGRGGDVTARKLGLVTFFFFLVGRVTGRAVTGGICVGAIPFPLVVGLALHTCRERSGTV